MKQNCNDQMIFKGNPQKEVWLQFAEIPVGDPTAKNCCTNKPSKPAAPAVGEGQKVKRSCYAWL